jgi:hypothetical protein
LQDQHCAARSIAFVQLLGSACRGAEDTLDGADVDAEQDRDGARLHDRAAIEIRRIT